MDTVNTVNKMPGKKSIYYKIKYYSFFIPFRFQFVLLSVALLLAYRWLQKTNVLPETSYTAILDVFITVSLWFISAIFIISFLTAVIPWVFFLLNKKNKIVSINIKTPQKQNLLNQNQPVQIQLEPVIKPVFGYLRLRLKYDDEDISPKFSLIKTESKTKFFSTSIKGIYNWPLQQIKEYKVSESILYFEDMFQFFSFTATLPAQNNFYTQPPDTSSENFKVQPKKTEDTNTRIDQIRKVEGEFLNYKNFENNDDVRRIVWKIYAKNKELVVRIPETNDPYASHVYFYASFYNSLSSDFYKTFNHVFLDHYKTFVWSAFQQLSKQNILLKYIPDQEAKIPFSDDQEQKIKYTISTSNWQMQKDLQEYFKKEEASVLCISSLIKVNQLAAILETSGKDHSIIFVPVSQSFNSMKVTDWFKWIFIKPGKDSLEKIRLGWNISSLKRKILDNEKQIKSLLEKSDCEIVVL